MDEETKEEEEDEGEEEGEEEEGVRRARAPGPARRWS